MPWIIANIIDLLIEYDNIMANADPIPIPLCAAAFFTLTPPSPFYLISSITDSRLIDYFPTLKIFFSG
jgi:hypothetical protein